MHLPHPAWSLIRAPRLAAGLDGGAASCPHRQAGACRAEGWEAGRQALAGLGKTPHVTCAAACERVFERLLLTLTSPVLFQWDEASDVQM